MKLAELDEHADIPGTTFFDGTQAMKGFALNKMCYSFNSQEARDEYLADPAAYYARFKLTAPQILACENKNVLELIAAGGNIYYLAKFAGIFKLSVQDVGAQQTGMTTEEFKEKLLHAGDK